MSRQQANWTTWFLAAATAVVALGVCTTPALAQSITGTILGTVKDPQGGVLPGATLVLTSESRGTKGVPVITDSTGSYNLVNLQPDTYVIEVTMTGFKVYKRTGIALGAGERLVIPVVLEVGGTSETIDVTAEAPLVQAQSGERSFSVSTDMVANLPMSNRTFAALAGLAPGVTGGNNPSRIGGGGSNNITIDGMGNIDSGNNGQMLAVTNEVVAEVKVLTSNYQAEFGRNSGLQITAITKSGTNRFRGSVYDVERNSNWNAARRMDELLGTPRTVSKARDWGFTIGGPVGKPGGNNKLFFFYAQEMAPRKSANAVTDFRMPTELERQGDFSQSRDNQGNPFPYIRDPLSTLPCQTTPTGDHRGCFADGGVLGRIPTNRLYAPGLNVLRMFPLPNLTDIPAGQNFNTRFIAPEFSLTSTQPVVRVDYMPSSAIRVMFRYTGWRQPNKVITGSIPEWNDTTQVYPHIYQLGGSVNWTINSTTFLEASYGLASEEEAGCAMGAAPGPVICRNGFAVNPIANRFNAGLGDLPYIFPDAGLVDPDYYAYRALNSANSSIWDATQGRIVRPQSFNWGNRVSPAPPSVGYPGFLLKMYIHDYSGSVTRVAGRHTIKGGFYWQDNLKYQQRTNPYGTINFGNATTNPIDSGFGFANAALGIFTSYDQASKYVEGGFSYNQIEGYVQDNWKITARLTLDYGVRLVHQQPQYDYRRQSTNFLPETYDIGQAPVLYEPACPGNAAGPCANTRQAKNPITGQLLGPGTSAAIGTLVPNSGNTLNGIHIPGDTIVDTTYKWPGLVVGPRFGAAYDVTGKQSVVLRGGAGVFFNRTSGNSVYDQISNPPTVRTVTLFNSTLDTLQNNNQQVQGAPNLSVFNYDAGVPTSAQWNGGIQMMLPWATAIDVEYVGQHSWNELEGTNLNSIDLGTLFNPSAQDPTQPVTTPGSNTLPVNMLRAYQGYGTINQQWARGWRWFHSLQFSINRRFRNGLAFGFNNAIALSNSQSTAARLEHRPDGSYVERADQAEADRLLGTDPGPRHNMKANFVWDLPDMTSNSGAMRAVALVVNDWQLSGIWTGVSGSSYTVGYSYQNGTANANLTGSSDYNARIRVLGDPGSGCQGNQYRQFNTDAFAGPLVGSVGLESGNQYLKGCFSSVFDLAIARNINFGGGRLLQLRIEMFNAFNRQSVTGRQTTMNLNSTSDPTTITNLPYDANGDLIVARSLPNNSAGFGVATAWQDPRAIQLQVRFQF